jgi:transketolase
MIVPSDVPLSAFSAPPRALAATRDAFGRRLLSLGREDPRIVVLDADLSRSTRTEWWGEAFPERFFNCGIAEQNMIGVAAGLAASGLVPFAVTYAIFIGRAFDQIRQSVAFARQNVKIVASHAGYAASYDGGSHQGLEDLALMRVLPGMTVLSPMDASDAAQAVELAAAIQGPVYLRLQKEPSPLVTVDAPPLTLDRTLQWGEGRDVALVATGTRVAASLAAAAALEQEGVGVRVLGVAVLKPFDVAALRATAQAVRLLVTVEEHMAIGGLHEAVCAAVQGLGCPVLPVAAERFGETGSWDQLLARNGMDGPGIAGAVRRRLAGRVTA